MRFFMLLDILNAPFEHQHRMKNVTIMSRNGRETYAQRWKEGRVPEDYAQRWKEGRGRDKWEKIRPHVWKLLTNPIHGGHSKRNARGAGLNWHGNGLKRP